MRLSEVALGVAIGEAAHGVHEESENDGTRIREYLEAANIHHPAPWCAAFVQYCSDKAAKLIGAQNPLDRIELEGLVQDYVDSLECATDPRRGDLVAYRWNGADRFNHLGIVMDPPDDARYFWAVEGNTSEMGQIRDGEGVYRKRRRYNPGTTLFLRW